MKHIIVKGSKATLKAEEVARWPATDDHDGGIPRNLGVIPDKGAYPTKLIEVQGEFGPEMVPVLDESDDEIILCMELTDEGLYLIDEMSAVEGIDILDMSVSEIRQQFPRYEHSLIPHFQGQ